MSESREGCRQAGRGRAGAALPRAAAVPETSFTETQREWQMTGQGRKHTERGKDQAPSREESWMKGGPESARSAEILTRRRPSKKGSPSLGATYWAVELELAGGPAPGKKNPFHFPNRQLGWLWSLLPRRAAGDQVRGSPSLQGGPSLH